MYSCAIFGTYLRKGVIKASIPQETVSKSLLKIFCTNFLDMLGFGLVLPVFGFLFFPEGGDFSAIYNEDQLTRLYVILLASFSLGTFIGAPFIGAMSDKYGRKSMLYFTYALNILFYLTFTYGIATLSYFILWLSRVFGGLTGGSLLVVQSAIADVSPADKKAENFGKVTGVAFGLGFVLGALIGGIISNEAWHPAFNNQFPFYASCVVTFLNILFLTFVFKETNHNRTSKNISLLTGPKNLIRAFTQSNLKHIFIVILLITFSFNFFVQLIQFYAMDEFGLNKTQVGYFLGFVGVSIAVAQGLILPFVSKRIKPEKLLLFSLPCFALVYLAVLVPDKILGLCLVMFILTICQALTFPASLSIVSNLAERNIQGETIGVNQSVQSFAATIPILISFFITANYAIPMYVAALGTLFAWIWYLFNRQKILSH